MTRLDWRNGTAALLVVTGALVGTAFVGGVTAPERAYDGSGLTRLIRIPLPGGGEGLQDAAGELVPIGSYQRIAGASTVSSQVLWAIAEPHRVVAFSRYSAEEGPDGFRFSGKTLLASLADVETLVALKPDLVFANTIADRAKAARLRDAGLRVFDLGNMKGLQTLYDDIAAIATLIGEERRGAALIERLRGRLQRLKAAAPAETRSAIFLQVYGGKLYGGTKGSSYHDILDAAGLRDAAADVFTDWPQYDPEHVLELDPDIIVTLKGAGEGLCRQPGLSTLRACTGRGGGRLVEMNAGLLGDAGLGILDAAEVLQGLVYGQ